MKYFAVIGFFAQKIMSLAWAVVGMLFFPAMDGRFQLITDIARYSLSIALVSSVLFIVCLTLFKNSK